MNIYRAKILDTNEYVQGQYYYSLFEHIIVTDSDRGFGYKINPHSLELVSLDFNDAQKKLLLKEATEILKSISKDMDWIKNTSLDILSQKDFEALFARSKKFLNSINGDYDDGIHRITHHLKYLEEAFKLLKGI